MSNETLANGFPKEIQQAIDIMREQGVPEESIRAVEDAMRNINLVRDGRDLNGTSAGDKSIVIANEGQQSTVKTRGGDDLTANIAADGGRIQNRAGQGADTDVSYAINNGSVVFEAGQGNDEQFAYVDKAKIRSDFGSGKDTGATINQGGYHTAEMGAGADTHVSYASNHGTNIVKGDHGKDMLFGYADGAARYEADGGQGHDTVVGLAGNGAIMDVGGGQGADVVAAVNLGNATTSARGGAGNDTVIGANAEGGHLHMQGDKGADTMIAVGKVDMHGGAGRNEYLAIGLDGVGATNVHLGSGAETVNVVDTGGQVNVNGFNPVQDTIKIHSDKAFKDAASALRNTGVTLNGVDANQLDIQTSTTAQGITTTEISGGRGS